MPVVHRSSRSNAHSELPDASVIYRSTHHSMPDTASTSSAHHMASTFIGMQGRSVNMDSFCDTCADRRHRHMPPNARKALEGATFIAKHLGGEDDAKKVSSLVFDRHRDGLRGCECCIATTDLY